MTDVDRVSIEPSRRCSKACSFCYNASDPAGDGAWSVADVVDLARDCAAGGVRYLSFGGGEPLEWEGIFDALTRLRGVLARSLTTNGLPLDDGDVFDRLVAARPDRVHVSIHAPENAREVTRVVHQVHAIAAAGIPSGVNLLVRASRLIEATVAARTLHAAGIRADRIVYLPMRAEGGADAPSAAEVARVAGAPFRAMSCLGACARSPRFASIAADRTVAWCSYTRSRRPLAAATHRALVEALEGLDLTPCSEGLVALRTPRRTAGSH